VLVLAAVGLVAALGYAVENAHQSWGAVYLGDVLAVSPGLTATAPALFAGVVAVTRFAVGALPPVRPMVLLVTGGLAATAGALALAGAQSLVAALAGLACAAAGTAVLFPTLLAAGVGHAEPALRGRATSVVSTTAYLGFLLGPVFVGRLADGSDLRAAMTGVAVLAAVCTLACWPALRAVRALAAATDEDVRR
jgi:MFS family permease